MIARPDEMRFMKMKTFWADMAADWVQTQHMKKLFFALLVLVSLQVRARVVSDNQGWMNLNAFISAPRDWQFYLEVQPRFIEQRHDLGITLYRAAVGRTVAPGLSVWLGYGFIEYSHPQDSYEDRPFLQLLHTHAFEKFKLTNRTRWEGRFLQNHTPPSSRFRHLLRLQWRTPLAVPIAVVVWDEWFWNSNSIKAGPQEGFDQNRAFVGMGWLFGEEEKNIIELGYMNQYVNGAVDRRNHVLAGQLTVRY